MFAAWSRLQLERAGRIRSAWRKPAPTTLPAVHPLKAESFDRYGRYSHVGGVRDAMGSEPIAILDVGDPYGVLGRLFDGDFTVSIDFLHDLLPSLGHAHVCGSGGLLPFRTDAFDLVTSHDALEHVPGPLRMGFIQELLRVSRGPVLLVHPVADPRTQRAEEIVNGYYTARFGSGIHQLEEHRQAQLPELRWLTSQFEEMDVSYVTWGDGWLFSWLAFMLVKAHHVSEYKGDIDRQIDIAYNELLREVDRRPPHYRRAVLLRPPPGFAPPRADQPEEDGDVAADVSLLMELGVGLIEALPRGRDALAPGSLLRDWIARQRGRRDPVGEVAEVLEIAIDAARPPVPAPVEELTPRTEALPSVSFVVVNLDGAEHLRTCLPSLAALDYPRARLEIIVVDNGSSDESLDVLADYDVRVLPQDTNLGFSPAVNVGVRASTADCVVFLNNDIRVEPDFLLRLVEAYAPEEGVTCVGAQILSWDGASVDFAGSAMNFYGMGSQLGYGLDRGSIVAEDGASLLFACGGAMLISRDVYLEVGGFDDDYFAYFEDVDLGWRLNLCGHRVRLAAKATCYHRMHGTSSRFPYHQRLFLYERNALFSILKNYEAANLPKALAGALLLLAKRAVVAGELDGGAFTIGGDPEPAQEVPRVGLAALHAVEHVVGALDAVLAKRDRIQAMRKVSDAELFELFGRPFLPTEPESSSTAAQHDVIRLFGLDRLFARARASSVLVVTGERVGEKMRGPAIRALEMSRALAGAVCATLAVPEAPDVDLDTLGVRVDIYRDGRELAQLAAAADVVIVQGYTLRRHPELRSVEALLVADLYDPWLFEAMEVHRGAAWGNEAVHQDVSVLNELLDEADLFICASERQRDYWLGMLAARGRLDQTLYEGDPSFRDLIDVVPFGLPSRPPSHHRQVLKGVHPAVGADDQVVLWGGGAWDWFDPISVIRAFRLVVDRLPTAKLYFLGLQLVDDNVDEMQMARRAVETAEELGLAGTSVIFGDWAPYEDREAFLVEADVAVTAARDLAETRLAFRSRLLDAFWAGLPVVATSGDILTDEVREHGAGIVVPAGDVAGLADALVRLLGDPVLRASCASRSQELSFRYRWGECVAPLRRVLERPWRHLEARRRRPGRKTETSNIVIRQLREQAQHMGNQAQNMGNQASAFEMLLGIQTERAELHLNEVKDLLESSGETERRLALAEQRISQLQAAISSRDEELHRLRSHPAIKTLLRAREMQHRLGGSDRD